jgi:hypothetical protein
MIDHPWDLVEHNAAALADDHLHWHKSGIPQAKGVTVSGPLERCLAAPTANIDPM